MSPIIERGFPRLVGFEAFGDLGADFEVAFDEFVDPRQDFDRSGCGRDWNATGVAFVSKPIREAGSGVVPVRSFDVFGCTVHMRAFVLRLGATRRPAMAGPKGGGPVELQVQGFRKSGF